MITPQMMGIILECARLPASEPKMDLEREHNKARDPNTASQLERQKIIKAVGLEDSDEENSENEANKVVKTQEEIVNTVENQTLHVGNVLRA